MTGHPQQAIAAFVELMGQHQPKGLRRATVLQHLGKAELAAGEHQAAIDHLELALELRRTHGAPADQIASSELMVSIGEGYALRWRSRTSGP